uniref:Rhomboid-like protein n=1 Tax=Rhizophora mucronata TaxID=61149 RepID=A0A2P2MSJ3_RHIMU
MHHLPLQVVLAKCFSGLSSFFWPSGSNAENFSGDFREESLVAKPFSGSKGFRLDGEGNLKSIPEVRSRNVDSHSELNESLKQYDETSDLYFVGMLASIDIAVFLFEIASPVRNSQYELFSLPLAYGAKINDLILLGEWWRLVTPMFLHSGAFHLALGCWSLLTFGPQVCRTYGSFTFFLIYMLGGISGNLTSYLHTQEPTVGGTGPVFAIIGAWLAYQIQNRGVTAKDVSECMFQKAVVITALSCILSNFGPIDDWTHLGAAITGIVYGFFTCPTLQMDDASPRTGREEGIALVRRYADPCKSLMVFTISILVLGSLLFLVEPPLDTIMVDF